MIVQALFLAAVVWGAWELPGVLSLLASLLALRLVWKILTTLAARKTIPARGFGIFTPFGLSANSTNFNDADPNLTKFVGRFDGTRVRLESYWFQPTIAYKIKENLAFSVAPAFVHTHLERPPFIGKAGECWRRWKPWNRACSAH